MDNFIYMKNYWRMVNKVIRYADVLLLLLDARLVEDTRNLEIENKVKDTPLIYVITKCDLVSKKLLEKYKKELKPCVIVSSKMHFGTTLLRDSILIEAKRVKIKKNIKVGVLGYPNVGKSSLINAMKGRHAAATSIVSGFTKGVQEIRGDNRIMFLDTPGVIPYKEKDMMKHTRIGSIDFNKSKDSEMAVIGLMTKFQGKIESYYGVDILEDEEQTIEEIAIKKKMLRKGGIPDLARTSRMILKDWQKGLILNL
jgi:hypothetical protein